MRRADDRIEVDGGCFADLARNCCFAWRHHTKADASLAVVGAALTMQEGAKPFNAVQTKGLLLSDLDADGVSEALGHDPFDSTS